MTIEQVVRRVLVEDHADVIRESVRFVAEQIMEAEVSELVGAGLGERTPEDRATHRNGYRTRRWDTRAGEIELQIPKLRQGSYFPSFLTPRKRSEQALVVVAHAVHETGRREIIGLDIGAAETEAFWTEFLRSLVARGLVGVKLAISDAHQGLKNALAKVLGVPWQRCTVHFLRDLRGHVHRDQHDALGAVIRSIFTAPDGTEARRRLADAVNQLQPRLPKIAALLEEAEEDVLAFFSCPQEHWPKIRSTDEKFKGRRGYGSASSRFWSSPRFSGHLGSAPVSVESSV